METATQKAESNELLLDLAEVGRWVRIRAGQQIYRHIFKRITQAEWEAYAKGAGAVLLQEGATLIPQGGDEQAAWDFWERNVQRVEGYTQTAITEAAAGWKEFLPAMHQLWAVEMLREVYLEEVSDDGEFSLVRLSANWNERVFDQLVHRFRQPTKDQVLRYRRTGARFLRVGGSRKNQTQIVIPSRLGELCRLYDELIVARDGYANENSGVDALHKSTAVNGLFDPRGLSPANEAAA